MEEFNHYTHSMNFTGWTHLFYSLPCGKHFVTLPLKGAKKGSCCCSGCTETKKKKDNMALSSLLVFHLTSESVSSVISFLVTLGFVKERSVYHDCAFFFIFFFAPCVIFPLTLSLQKQIIVDPLAFSEERFRPSLEERLESIISGAALMADSSCTRDDRRERIVAECNSVRQALQDLLSEYMGNVSLFSVLFCHVISSHLLYCRQNNFLRSKVVQQTTNTIHSGMD